MVEQFDKAKRYALIRQIHRKLEAKKAKKKRVNRMLERVDDLVDVRYDDHSGIYWSDEQRYISTHYKDSISVNKNRGNFDDGY
jgi:hypothetical protein